MGDENKGVTEQLMKESLEKAVNALGYFQTEIGGYPHKQIDIFLGENYQWSTRVW